jgi:flagellar assembly protein FliH
MNLPSEGHTDGRREVQRYLPAGNLGAAGTTPFFVPEKIVSPFEFRSLTGQEVERVGVSSKSGKGVYDDERGTVGWAASELCGDGVQDLDGRSGTLQNSLHEAVIMARQEGFQEGEREGLRAVRAEMEAEMRAGVMRERERLAGAVKQFHAARERYFAEVEQEVVRLALGIAARVLHREASIDPLLLAGVVRVALEKMADRSGVVLRVAAPDVEGWERIFHATEPSERPRVSEDARLERGECVLETRMGTVELGVAVQLQEIEKGFFDLLNHRPVE